MAVGAGILHLMPPPFYAYRMVVAKARSPEESIQGMIDKIVDATATNRYKIEVMPGVYSEAVTMKAYVDVVAPYGRVLIQPPATSAFAVTMASDTMLQGVQIDLSVAAATATGVVIGALTNVTVEDCWITGGAAGDLGITDASTGTSVIIRKNRIDSVETCYRKTATGTTWVADNRMTALTDGTDVDADLGTINLFDNELMAQGTGYNLDLAGAAVTVNSYSNSMTNTNTTGAAIRIGSHDSAWVYSYEDNFSRVTHSGLGHMVYQQDIQTFYIYNGMKIADATTRITALGDAAAAKRYLIHVFAGVYAEALTMLQYVDLVGESNESVIISQANATVITLAADSRVKSVQVQVTAAIGVAGIVANNLAGLLEDVVVSITSAGGVNYAVSTTGTGGIEIHDCEFTVGAAADFALNISGTGTNTAYDSEFINTVATGYAVNVGSAATLSSFNSKLRATNGFYLVSNAATLVLSYGDDYTNVVFSGATGAFVDLSDCKLYTCATGVAVGEWVFASGADTVTEADSDALATMPSIGVAVYKPTATSCYVKQTGYAYDSSGPWVTGATYWISGTAGQITTVMPGVWPQQAGIAVSTQRFKILLGPNLGLVHTNVYNNAGGVVAVNNWVYITAVNSEVAPALATLAATMPAIGVVVEVIDATTCRVRVSGKHSQATLTFVASDDCFVSTAVAGAIVNVAPLMGIIQKVAEVKSDDGVNTVMELV